MEFQWGHNRGFTMEATLDWPKPANSEKLAEEKVCRFFYMLNCEFSRMITLVLGFVGLK